MILKFHLSIFFMLSVGIAAGGKPGKFLSLDAALREGLRNHPTIIAGDSELRVRIAETLAVTQIPNPRLEAEFRKFNDEPVVELKLMQPIKRSYFGLRNNYANIERMSARADTRAQIAGVLNDVYSRYLELWTVQELQGIRERNRADFLSLRDDFQRRVEAGQGSAVDLALLDAEIANQAAEAQALEGQALARSAALAYRIGRKSGGLIMVERPSGLPLPASSSSLEDFAIRRTPLRLALMKREEAALAKLAIVRSDRYAPIEAGLIAEHDTDRGGILLGIGFNMDLPFWNKNEAAIASAQASVEAARNDLRTQEPGRVAALVKLRYRSAQAAERSAAKFSGEVVPLFETALTQTKEAIAKGQIGTVAIQPVITRLTESRLRSFELTVAAFEARAELEAAIGGRLEEALGSSIR